MFHLKRSRTVDASFVDSKAHERDGYALLCLTLSFFDSNSRCTLWLLREAITGTLASFPDFNWMKASQLETAAWMQPFVTSPENENLVSHWLAWHLVLPERVQTATTPTHGPVQNPLLIDVLCTSQIFRDGMSQRLLTTSQRSLCKIRRTDIPLSEGYV